MSPLFTEKVDQSLHSGVAISIMGIIGNCLRSYSFSRLIAPVIKTAL